MAIRPLKNRSSGFASFEKYLIEHSNIGWIHKLSRNVFVLRKSPFTDIKTPHAYVMPDGMDAPNGSFVQVELNEKNAKHVFINNSVMSCYRVSEIHCIRLVDLEMPKPYLYNNDFVYNYLCIKDEFRGGNEFINRIASYWKNADADGLDLSLAIQLLSCPKWFYGIGGIGAVTASLAGSKKTPFRDIKSCVNQLLPRDFRANSKLLKYAFIENKNNFKNVEFNRLSRNSSEVSYNYLDYIPRGNVPIQLPVVIENAEFRGKIKDEDPDITEYILTSLMISPPENEMMIKQIENTMTRVREKLNSSQSPPGYVDIYSPIKIALAFCRMNLMEELDENTISRSLDHFSDLYEKYIDATDYLVKINPNRETRVIPRARGPIHDPIHSQETRIHRIILEISEEFGIEWVHISEIKNHIKFNKKWDDTLMDSLKILNNSGLILTKNNFNEFKSLKID